MVAEKNKIVSIVYELHVDDGENGKEFFEKVEASEPYAFLFGADNLLPKLEEAMVGKGIGDAFEVSIGYLDGYGDYDESKKVIVPKTAFKEDGKLQRDLMKVGKVVSMQDDKGNPMQGEILKIDYRGVLMDFNSPLAGLDLYFKGEIVGIRDAEPIELEHGHAHGPDGHHHH
ncbi:FKBP-type peptidyl-prolyl cis-trans isomerase [Lunatibacter salilacus]|uniref:FKBP-type peptidyl-prolyl cis-trans isomerase n=1 Tax=Lunatibacter salilacus TaxID=2483804 RepID=UPI00131C4E52|nr:FKBP-type peptidyl-prolyl cis-trans isomerase [Lunatibacter salilacus]